MRQAPHLPNLGALPAVLIWGVVGLVTMAKSLHAMVTKPQPWLIHEWMEEKDPNLPKELCSLGFVLWVSFSLLSYYPVLRETYIPLQTFRPAGAPPEFSYHLFWENWHRPPWLEQELG